MDRAQLQNGGAFARSARVAGNNTATAAGTGDATQVNGAWLDRKITNVGLMTSAKLIINYSAVLADTKSLSFDVQFQDATSSGGAGSANYKSALGATIVATSSGGSTETGTLEVDVDLESAREFVRAQITPDLSASGTDTCAWSAVMVFFGGNHQPISKAAASIGSPV